MLIRRPDGGSLPIGLKSGMSVEERDARLRPLHALGSPVARLLSERPLIVLAVLSIAAGVIIVGHIDRLQSNLVEEQALQTAKLLTTALTEFRSLYTSDVVERVRPIGVTVSHDYKETEGAIPLPATLSMALGNRIGAQGAGVETRLYSAYPFPYLPHL